MFETREEKFRKYREEIKNKGKDIPKANTEEYFDDGNQPFDEYKKRNTLTMSIDQIISAHDQYTTIIQKKEMEEKIKEEKKADSQKRTRNILKIILISIAVLAFIALVVILITLILR